MTTPKKLQDHMGPCWSHLRGPHAVPNGLHWGPQGLGGTNSRWNRKDFRRWSHPGRKKQQTQEIAPKSLHPPLPTPPLSPLLPLPPPRLGGLYFVVSSIHSRAFRSFDRTGKLACPVRRHAHAWPAARKSVHCGFAGNAMCVCPTKAYKPKHRRTETPARRRSSECIFRQAP
jgi:hypothetical protein